MISQPREGLFQQVQDADGLLRRHLFRVLDNELLILLDQSAKQGEILAAVASANRALNAREMIHE